MEKKKAKNPGGNRGKTRLHRVKRGTRAPWEPSVTHLRIYARVVEGRSYSSVGKEFQLKHTSVSKICANVDRWLVPQFAESVRLLKARHTESLLHIFREAMAAWEKSCRPALTVATKTDHDGKTRKERKVEFQCGNPSFLEQARAALREIRDIWGANAPVKVEHSGELRVAGMSVEDANRQLSEQLEAARQKLLTLAPSEN